MTYSIGGQIQATDYNNFTGTTAVNAAYASSAAATAKMAALIGVGYGDRGYGQTSATLSTVAAGNTVTAAQWNNLQSTMSTMNTHQGSGLTLQPVVSVGGTILAEDGELSRPNISSLISSLDTNRLNATVTDMTVTAALSSSQATGWSGTVQHVFTAVFATVDQARYYFNTGGQIRFAGSNTGSTTPAGAAWATLLSAMGTISFGAGGTSYTGSGGTITNNIGYYNLTTSPTQIFIHNGAAPYAGIYYAISIQTNATGTANGSNGSTITCTATFNDSSAPHGPVTGTTTSSISSYKASNSGALNNPAVAAPTFTTTTPL